MKVFKVLIGLFLGFKILYQIMTVYYVNVGFLNFFQDMSFEYEQKKQAYDSCALGLDSNISKIEQVCMPPNL